MAVVNPVVLMKAYDSTVDLVAGEPERVQMIFSGVEIDFEEKKRNPDSCIMVYGVYNAGKSTLINALIGRQEAPVGDVPLTSKVSAYRWGSYEVLDTPGVDAPSEHEKVTQSQMAKADAVIFVMNPVGVAEEGKTLEVLLDLLQEKKKVFIAFNIKNELKPENFLRLKDLLREKIQEMAEARGISGVLKDVPIFSIDAKRALKAKQEGKARLLESSGYPAFENALHGFLRQLSPDDVYDRLKHKLICFLDERTQEVKSSIRQDGTSKKINAILEQMVVEKSRIEKNLLDIIDEQKDYVYRGAKSALRSGEEDLVSKALKDVFVTASGYVVKRRDEALDDYGFRLQGDVDGLQFQVLELQQKPQLRDMLLPRGQNGDVGHEAVGLKKSSLPVEAVAGYAQKAVAMVKGEHVVTALKMTKDYFPSLMKGVGPKTMEKIAGRVMDKIPYIGYVLTAVNVLSGLMGEDEETRALREQVAQQRWARERAEQQMEDFSVELATDFYRDMRSEILNDLSGVFKNLRETLSVIRNDASEQERMESEYLQQWMDIRQMAQSA